MTRALVLLAHGARDPRWAAPFEAMADHLRSIPGLEVRLAFMELLEPRWPAVAGELAATGSTQVDVIPVFLGAGGHVQRDLPRLVQAAQEAYPTTRWLLHPPLGEAPAVIRALAMEAARAAGLHLEARR